MLTPANRERKNVILGIEMTETQADRMVVDLSLTITIGDKVQVRTKNGIKVNETVAGIGSMLLPIVKSEEFFTVEGVEPPLYVCHAIIFDELDSFFISRAGFMNLLIIELKKIGVIMWFDERDGYEALIPLHDNSYFMWSGGVDSTFMLLAGTRKLNSVGITPTAVSIHHEMGIGEGQLDMEMCAQDDIMAYFDGLGLHVDNFTINISATTTNVAVARSKATIGQMGAWLALVLPAIPDNSIVHFGYLRDDESFMFFKETFSNAFKAMIDLTQKPNVVFNMPLFSADKVAILEALMTYDRTLAETAWFCENPSEAGDICWSCPSCEKQLRAMTIIQHRESMLNGLRGIVELSTVDNVITVDRFNRAEE